MGQTKEVNMSNKKPLGFNAFTESEDPEVEMEALNIQQRMARKRSMAKNKAKMALGRARAAKKVASMEVLKKRAVKAARTKIALKMTKGVPLSEVPISKKIEIEKKLEKKKGKINKVAKKLLPDIKKKEAAKLQKNKKKSDK
jgi:hypothetical protein